ncbi:hypothetical protein F4818DRAFT_451832 [Hypoxylon cercidicola]|nr:hypothetical protein F4818DRAFT_451832 [Hypoxylon cercidicola]
MSSGVDGEPTSRKGEEGDMVHETALGDNPLPPMVLPSIYVPVAYLATLPDRASWLKGLRQGLVIEPGEVSRLHYLEVAGTHYGRWERLCRAKSSYRARERSVLPRGPVFSPVWGFPYPDWRMKEPLAAEAVDLFQALSFQIRRYEIPMNYDLCQDVQLWTRFPKAVEFFTGRDYPEHGVTFAWDTLRTVNSPYVEATLPGLRELREDSEVDDKVARTVISSLESKNKYFQRGYKTTTDVLIWTFFPRLAAQLALREGLTRADLRPRIFPLDPAELVESIREDKFLETRGESDTGIDDERESDGDDFESIVTESREESESEDEWEGDEDEDEDEDVVHECLDMIDLRLRHSEAPAGYTIRGDSFISQNFSRAYRLIWGEEGSGISDPDPRATHWPPFGPTSNPNSITPICGDWKLDTEEFWGERVRWMRPSMGTRWDPLRDAVMWRLFPNTAMRLLGSAPPPGLEIWKPDLSVEYWQSFLDFWWARLENKEIPQDYNGYHDQVMWNAYEEQMARISRGRQVPSLRWPHAFPPGPGPTETHRLLPGDNLLDTEELFALRLGWLFPEGKPATSPAPSFPSRQAIHLKPSIQKQLSFFFPTTTMSATPGEDLPRSLAPLQPLLSAIYPNLEVKFEGPELGNRVADVADFLSADFLKIQDRFLRSTLKIENEQVVFTEKQDPIRGIWSKRFLPTVAGRTLAQSAEVFTREAEILEAQNERLGKRNFHTSPLRQLDPDTTTSLDPVPEPVPEPSPTKHDARDSHELLSSLVLDGDDNVTRRCILSLDTRLPKMALWACSRVLRSSLAKARASVSKAAVARRVAQDMPVPSRLSIYKHMVDGQKYVIDQSRSGTNKTWSNFRLPNYIMFHAFKAYRAADATPSRRPSAETSEKIAAIVERSETEYGALDQDKLINDGIRGLRDTQITKDLYYASHLAGQNNKREHDGEEAPDATKRNRTQ